MQEYLAGTDPLNSSSILKILELKKSGADIAVTWSSVDAVYYQLQRSETLVAPNWVNVGAPVRGFGSPAGTWDYGAATRAAQQFYRVMVVPPP
jgi:hypothetical protein